MTHNRVSVIVPVYQVSAYVERCLRSVMAQTYPDMECIIVDDATKDDSIEKCERLIRRYDGAIRFRILHHDRNRGLSAARNTGTKAAVGDYLYYLDSDDYLSPDCIARLAAVVNEDNGIEMVQGNGAMKSDGAESFLYRADHPILTRNYEETRRAFFQDRYIYISVWNKLIKKSLIEEHQIYCREGMVFEDLLWVFYLMKHLKRTYLCEAVTYYWCIRPGSIMTAAKAETFRCYALIFDEILLHTTAGREREELDGYLYYFVKRYVSYVKLVPAFKDTIRRYRAKARQYHCWKTFMVLSAASIVARFGNPSRLLERMNAVRWKLTKGK